MTLFLSSAEGWEDRQQSQRLGWAQLPTWGCGSLPPLHTHTASTPRGAERKTEGNGGEAAKVQSPGSANRPVQLCPLSGPPSPPAHTNTEAEAGSGRGRLSPAPPHTPPVPKSHARKKATRLGGLQGPCPFGAFVKRVSDACPQKRPGPETPGSGGGGGEWGWGAPCAPPAAPSARAPGLRAVSVRCPDPRSRRPRPDGPGRAEPSYLRPGTCWPPCPPARPRSPSRAPPAAAASASTAAAAASPRGRGRDGEGTPREGAVPAPSAGRASPSGPGRPERGRDGVMGCGDPGPRGHPH